MSEWMQQEQATAIINGGYFDQEDDATALVVSSGKAFGESYAGFGGLVSVDVQGRGSLRSLRQHQYDANHEHLEQATQSSPIFMLAGKPAHFRADGSQARRS